MTTEELGKRGFKIVGNNLAKHRHLNSVRHRCDGCGDWTNRILEGALPYLFLRASFRLANPYMRRGSLTNRFAKSGPLTSPIRRAFLRIWITCGIS
jgi:hypothetical protein